MNYIIFDLEWNNSYNYKTKKGFNEIIEIGAVKLNDSLEIIDTFKQLIVPCVSNKLGTNFQRLTHITMEEINESGIPFSQAFSDFARWSGDNDTVFLSWSQSDLYALTDNYLKFKNTAYVEFIKKYADAQSYCMQFVEEHQGNQISLANCAEKFEIDIDTSTLHRALEDCFVAACCLKKVFVKERFMPFVKECDNAFFERLVFKPYFLTNKDKDIFDVNDVVINCSCCKGNVIALERFEFYNNTFKTAGKCSKCNKKFWIFIRAKQTYDGVVVTQRLVPINKRRAKNIN